MLSRRTRFFVAALGAIVGAGAISPSAPQFGVRRWPDWLAPCAIPELVAPVRCGTVRVVESGAWLGRTIPLRLVVVQASASRPVADPVLLLVGGPGQAATELVTAYAPQITALRSDRDVILIDQRGTGQETGLHCNPPASPADLMGRIFEPGRLVECRDALSQRADLTRYTTTNAASDYIKILRALRYSQVNVWGLSLIHI